MAEGSERLLSCADVLKLIQYNYQEPPSKIEFFDPSGAPILLGYVKYTFPAPLKVTTIGITERTIKTTDSIYRLLTELAESGINDWVVQFILHENVLQSVEHLTAGIAISYIQQVPIGTYDTIVCYSTHISLAYKADDRLLAMMEAFQ